MIAAPEQVQLVTPVEPVPLGQQRFAVSQLGFPLLSPIATQAARDDYADERNQPEVRFG